MNTYKLSWRRRIVLAAVVGVFGLALACGPLGGGSPGATPIAGVTPASVTATAGETTPPGPPAAAVELEAVYANVLYRPPGSGEQPLEQGRKLGVAKDGAVSVNNQGEAWLRFPAALVVRVYEHSQVTIEGRVGAAPTAEERIRLEGGALFGVDAQTEAQRHVTIEAGWAVIQDIGTQFLIYYDPASQFIWVVVSAGSVEITAAGTTVAVPGGWQTWAEHQQAPRLPIPATRPVIGNLAPLIEDISGTRLRDVDVLTNKQCSVANVQPNDPLNLRASPDSQSDLNIVDTMPLNAHFEALARTGDVAWIYGIGPTGRRGWAAAKYLDCAYDPALLTTDTQQLPPALANPSIPVPKPSETPTPTPTETPTPRDTTAPVFQTGLLYDPRQVYILECGVSGTPTFSVNVTDPDDTPTVELIYHYQLKRTAGPEHRVKMGGQQPTFATKIDIGQEIFNDLKAADSIVYELRATDSHGNAASQPGKPITIATGPC